MFQDIANLLLAGVAGWQAVETFHHGSIFRRARRFAIRCRDAEEAPVRNWFGTLLSCPFCLSVWVCGLLVAALHFIPFGSPYRLPIYALIATRIAQWANDVTARYNLSPDTDDEDEAEDVFLYDDVDDDADVSLAAPAPLPDTWEGFAKRLTK